MPSRAFPLVAWGTPSNIAGAGYSDFGTIAVTSGVTDPFGGTGAYTLNDTDAGNNSARLGATFTGLGTLGIVALCMKAGTAAGSRFALRDGSSYHVIGNVTWTVGVPSFAGVTGTPLTPIALGNGWYLFIVWANDFAAGINWRLELYPTAATASLTGSTSFYLQNMVLLDLLGTPKAFSRSAEGYEAVTAPSGVRDAWKVKAPDEVLQGRASWVPTNPRSFPQIVSGWDGQNEVVGVNCGVKAMLEAGWDMNLLRVATDRSVCTTYNDAYLTQPGMDWAPDLEGNADRALNLELVSSTPFVGF